MQEQVGSGMGGVETWRPLSELGLAALQMARQRELDRPQLLRWPPLRQLGEPHGAADRHRVARALANGG